jgi:release factor glutamine methyltransferase
VTRRSPLHLDTKAAFAEQCPIMPALLELLERTSKYFAEKGVPEPRAQAEWIFAKVLGCGRLDLFLRFDMPLAEETLARLRPLVARRARREPLQYVLGGEPFRDLKLKCDSRALIPRPETEYLVEKILERFKVPPKRVVDLGTGTGAIALSLAKVWPDTEVVAADFSDDALLLAKENAAENGLEGRVRFVSSDWFGSVEGSFDLVVSNPPYLTEAEWEDAEPEVRDWEPYEALVAGDEGLADLCGILEQASTRIGVGGLVALETGISHHEALSRIAKNAGYSSFECLRDLCDRPRYFLARL